MSRQARSEVKDPARVTWRGSLSETTIGAMRIEHVVGSIEIRNAGPSYSVARLCSALAHQGYEVTLRSLGTQTSETHTAYRDHRYKWELLRVPLLDKLGYSPTLRRALMDAAAETDLFHAHGLWRLPNVYPAAAARQGGKPLVLSPRGMLARSALNFSAVSKRAFWAFGQRRAVRSVSAFHATSMHEYSDIRSCGLPQPVAIIPNGIDIPEASSIRNETVVARPQVLFLGRIHPIKALDRLILAWRVVEADFPEWQLRLVGPSEIGYREVLQALIRENGLRSVELCDAAEGSKKQRLLEESELFVLPSLSENFAIAVAESLAAGTPVIASRGTPWQGLETNGCGWWIDHGVPPLAKALREAMSLSRNERTAMGERGRRWMTRDFSWNRIASDMGSVYEWLIRGGTTPDCVQVD